jgi:hypothetical protein
MLKNRFQDNTVVAPEMLLFLCQRGNCGSATVRRRLGAVERFRRVKARPQAMFGSYQRNIKRTLNDIRALTEEEDSDGYIFRPSRFALERAWELISNAYIELDTADRLPRPFVSPDGRGGIRIEWTLGDRVISLLCPSTPDRPGYIYHAANEEHGANRQVSADSLITSLRWLLDRD